ncbi:MAG: T9SS type A sorting domain-containing protein [Bacteroidota bacterium]
MPFDQTLNQRLSNYAQQVKHFKGRSKRFAMYAGAAILPTTVLPAVVFSQCGSPTVSVTPTGSYDFLIDLDGGGNDFSIQGFYNSNFYEVRLFNLNPTEFSVAATFNAAFNNNQALKFELGDVISSGFNFTNDTNVNIKNAVGGGNFAGNNPNAFIGVRKGNRYGFIQLTTNAVILPQFISVDENATGLAIPENTNATVQAGDCGTLLPVELIYFEVRIGKSGSVLEWKTASEQNNVGFEIERSEDAKNFDKIGWVDGHGTTLERQSYIFEDEMIKANTNYYYRLKQIDFDGSYEYSGIQAAHLKSETAIQIGEAFPNPIYERLSLPVWVEHQQAAILILFDANGKTLHTIQQNLEDGAQNISIDWEFLPSGIYFLKVQIGAESTYQRLVKA